MRAFVIVLCGHRGHEEPKDAGLRDVAIGDTFPFAYGGEERMATVTEFSARSRREGCRVAYAWLEE